MMPFSANDVFKGPLINPRLVLSPDEVQYEMLEQTIGPGFESNHEQIDTFLVGIHLFVMEMNPQFVQLMFLIGDRLSKKKVNDNL